MSEQDATTEVEPTETETVDVASLQAEVDKWKALSRKHENAFKSASKELEKFREAAMSDAERAVEQAKAEARQSAVAEFGSRLARAELAAEAAKAGVELPESLTNFLNLSSLVTESGEPDSDAISELVKSLAPKGKSRSFPQNVGLGPQQSDPKKGQLSRDDLKRMSYAEINKARREGRLNGLLGLE